MMGAEDLTAPPLLRPIRTTVSYSGEVGISGSKIEEETVEVNLESEGCHTPKEECHVLKPSRICPPAPRKKRPVKRKTEIPPQGFFVVPPDLNSIFLALPGSTKKIRAGKVQKTKAKVKARRTDGEEEHIQTKQSSQDRKREESLRED